MVISLLAFAVLAAAPPGFELSLAAGEPEVVFPMFAAMDERGRLFVAESSGLDLYAELSALTRKCRVRLLEDRDGDGRFESSAVFADRLVFPMGLVWRDGRLYVADPPELVALEDLDGDGRADARRTILAGFGHTDNGSLHGLVFGPDGLLYLTMGYPDGYRLKREDGSFLAGGSGALLRCRPDGSRPELIARGFDNLVEVVFLPGGEIIGTDNWFQLPVGGMRDALVHLVEGGLYPRQEDRGGPEEPLTGPPLPAVALFPAVALSGLAIGRGPSFPAEIHGDLFSAQHNSRKVGRHVLERNGATFLSRDHDFVTSDDPDFHPSDVLFSPEGDLLVVDTGGWYVQHCPTGRIRDSRAPGGIWRVRFQGAAKVADPLGLKIDWPRLGPEELATLLFDLRPCVRERAERSLAEHGPAAAPALASVLERADLPAGEHAINALQAIAGDSPLPPLRAALRSRRPDLAARAARALGLRGDREAAGELCRLLVEGARPVQLAAAEALSRCGDGRSVPALKTALAEATDRHLEHAVMFALHRLASTADLAAALGHPSPRVERAALLLLDQPPRGALEPDAVLARLSRSDPELRSTALSILTAHPAWAGAAVEHFRRELTAAATSADAKEEGLERLALAFGGEAAFADALGKALSDPDPAVAKRALTVLLKLARARPPAAPRSFTDGLTRLLASPDRALRAGAVEAAALLGIGELDATLLRLALDAAQPEDLRLEALRAAAPRAVELGESSFRFLASQLEASKSPLVRLRAAEALARSRLSAPQLREVLKAAGGDPLISPALFLPALGRTPAECAGEVADYLEHAVASGFRVRPAELRGILESLPVEFRDRSSRLLAFLEEASGGDRLRLGELEPLLSGGDPRRGREVFSGKRAPCSVCHRVAGEGGQVGPDLTRIGAVRSGRDLLESIVFPSSTFAQGYESWLVTTKDGRFRSGILAAQSPEGVVLRDASGAEEALRRDGIRSLDRQSTSLMPEGLDRALSPGDLRDLLAYLQTLR